MLVIEGKGVDDIVYGDCLEEEDKRIKVRIWDLVRVGRKRKLRRFRMSI